MIRKKRGKDMEEEKEMLLPRSAREGRESFGGWEGTGVAKMGEGVSLEEQRRRKREVVSEEGTETGDDGESWDFLKALLEIDLTDKKAKEN